MTTVVGRYKIKTDRYCRFCERSKTMNEKIKEMDVHSDKINRIINCALEEFSKHNYEKASTNSIVKAAGVSRGLMYHYFDDKKELYDFLIEFSVTILLDAFKKDFDWRVTDLGARMKQSIRIKLEVLSRYPYMFDFYIGHINRQVITQMNPEIMSQLIEIKQMFFRENIDQSVFAEGLDVDKAIQTIKWTMEKFSEEYQYQVREKNKPINLVEVFKEADAYVDFLIKAFYK